MLDIDHRPVLAFAGVMSVLLTLTLAGVCTAAPPASGPTERDLAEQILAATGVRGGLIVHLGCGDGRLTAALRANGSFLVHGLDADQTNVEKARGYLRDARLYGPVSVERLTDGRLPYIDNLVNLVVSENLGPVPMDEVLRVLCPDGVAYIRKDGQWAKTVKPRPKNIDEWTHDLHDASNNAVAHDSVVGPPRRLQWVGSPTWSRNHDHMASMSGLVSAGGRVFYIFDEGPTASIELPSKWSVIARDAFNGAILWKRPIANWQPQLYPFKSGPAQLPRRLVAVEDRVYVTLGLDAPLTALDAATGRTVRIYEDSKATEEVIASDGVLFLMVTDKPTDWSEFKPASNNIGQEKDRVARGWPWDGKPRHVMAVRADTGEALWKQDHPVVPLTLAADGQSVYFHDGEKIVCLNRKDGAARWSSARIAIRASITTCFAPTLVVYQDVVLFSGGTGTMTAVSAQTGKTLWSAEHPPSGHNSPEDLLVVNDLVWAGATATGKESGVFTGRDLHTGEVKSQFPPDVNAYWFHSRCHRSKATDHYLLTSRTGIEFVDVKAKHWITNHWVRGGCLYGIMPANGLIYTPPHDCACYVEAKLNGFCALAPAAAKEDDQKVPDSTRLDRGPAYDEPIGDAADPKQIDWPTYRHDAARSGFTKATISAELKPAWSVELGGGPVNQKLSSLVAAGDRVFVASVDTHTVYALDAASGKTQWTFTAGGRIDSPPTIYQGRAIFGSADGWVYCLRAKDGKLIWRFRAAPREQRLVAYEQLESAWPVHGSVLVQGDVVYCVAGRSMFLDGGMRLCRLDPKTGQKLSETALDDRDPRTGQNLQADITGLNMPVALPDILSSDGRFVYMRSQRFDMQGQRPQIGSPNVNQQKGDDAHLFSPTGFLDDAWWHRSYWVFGRSFAEGAGGWFRAGHFAPAGRLLAFDDAEVYGFGAKPRYYRWTTPVEYQLFASSKEPELIKAAAPAQRPPARARPANGMAGQTLPIPADKWSQEIPLSARAMVLAGRTLFVAGPPKLVDEQEAFLHFGDPQIKAKLAEQETALDGAKGALLLGVSAEDGKELAKYELDSLPVFDGMAVTNGRLYVSTKTGKVLCFVEKWAARIVSSTHDQIEFSQAIKPLQPPH